MQRTQTSYQEENTLKEILQGYQLLILRQNSKGTLEVNFSYFHRKTESRSNGGP